MCIVIVVMTSYFFHSIPFSPLKSSLYGQITNLITNKPSTSLKSSFVTVWRQMNIYHISLPTSLTFPHTFMMPILWKHLWIFLSFMTASIDEMDVRIPHPVLLRYIDHDHYVWIPHLILQGWHLIWNILPFLNLAKRRASTAQTMCIWLWWPRRKII